MHQDEIKEKRKEKWFEVWFMIEALGVAEDVVKRALERHVEKLANVKNVFVYQKTPGEIKKVEKPMKGVEEAYSQVIDVRFFVKDVFSLINLVLVYGPSAIEILGPEKKEINIEEVQNLTNMLAGVVHQFAAAGVGGIVISPDKK